MTALTIPTHFDGERIRLDEPVELPPNTRLLVTVVPNGEMDRDFWARLSAYGLSRAYSDDEPEYPDELITKVNPDYVGW